MKKPFLNILYTIIAGVLTLLPVSSLILELIESGNPNLSFNDEIYIFFFYAIKLIGFLIYFLVLKKVTRVRIAFTGIAGVFTLVSIWAYVQMSTMENKGIDSIGTALGYAIILQFSIFAYYIVAFILFLLFVKDLFPKRK